MVHWTGFQPFDRWSHMTSMSTSPTEQGSALTQLVAEYLQDRRVQCSPKTIKIYRDALEDILLPFCARRGVSSLDHLTAAQLNELVGGLLDGSGSRSGRALAKPTVSSYTRAINTFLTWAGKQGETVKAKAQRPAVGRRVLDVLSRDEITALEDAAVNERDKLIVRVLADTGVRLGGLLGLTLGDLLQDGRTYSLKVREKGDKERLVPIKPELYKRLRRFAEKTRPDGNTDRIFLTLRRSARTGQHEPISGNGVEQLFQTLTESAGLRKRVYPHLMRHSYATHFLRRGGNPLLLQQILGHDSLAMITATYSHLTISDAHAEAMRVLTAD
jgi:site-specific recombinase XerD